MESIIEAIKYAEKNAALIYTDKNEREQFLAQLKAEHGVLTKRTVEDRRLSTELAVETAKTFVEIGVGVLGGILALFQFTFDKAWGMPLGLLGLATILTIVSMICGFIAISRA
jgi:hypothetical protein